MGRWSMHMAEYGPGWRGPTLTNMYRMSGAANAIDSCRRLGIVLLANGTGVHAVPHARLSRYPALQAMVVRYRDEVMQLLDGLVE